MARKKDTILYNLFLPVTVQVNQFKYEIADDHRSVWLNCFLFLHLLAAPHLNQTKKADLPLLHLHSDIIRYLFRNQCRTIIGKLERGRYITVDHRYSSENKITKAYGLHPRLLIESNGFQQIKEPVNQHFMRTIRSLETISTGLHHHKPHVPRDAGREHVLAATHRLVLVDSPEIEATAQIYLAGTANQYGATTFFNYFNFNPLRNTGVDGFGHRVHSAITNLPKSFRQALRFRTALDSPLVELDIVNAQPFFLTAVTANLLQTFVPEASEAIPLYQRFEQEDDFLHFQTLCRNGEVYEYFIAKFNSYFKRVLTRRHCKKLVYHCFFSDYTRAVTRPLSAPQQLQADMMQIFQTEFPSVYEVFRRVKSLPWDFTVNRRGECKRYANNALLAQRLESELMFTRVIPKLLAHGIEDVVTVHDCVLVKQSDAARARQLMEEAFQEVGLYPQIHSSKSAATTNVAILPSIQTVNGVG